jgi:hypothetical protein
MKTAKKNTPSVPPFSFSSKVWVYPGANPWFFVTVPKKESDTLRAVMKHYPRRGFGAVKTSVTIGATSWTTSVFPESLSGMYILPIKKQVRKTEDLYEGDTTRITLTPLL